MSSRRRALMAVLATVPAVAGVASSVPAAAAPPPCDSYDYCAGDEITLPGSPPTGAEPGGEQVVPVGNDPAPANGQPRCRWVNLAPGPGATGPGSTSDPGDQPSAESHLIFEICDGEHTGRVAWSNPADPIPEAATPPPAAPSPEQLAATIRVRLEGNLPDPVAATSPPAGEPAVVNHPTFLAIDNWTSTITDEECAFVLCVTVTATPQLTWTPGEPNAPTLTCAGSGTRFDPTGTSPQDQAAQLQACAHAYLARTGATGRPGAWPGVATVTWTLTWTSTSGAGDDLPSITRSTDVPRAVDEVQAVVVR